MKKKKIIFIFLALFLILFFIVVNEIEKQGSFLSPLKEKISFETKYKIKKYLLPYKTIKALEQSIEGKKNKPLIKELKAKKQGKNIIFRGTSVNS